MDVSMGTYFFHLHGGSEVLPRRGTFRYTARKEKVQPGLRGRVMTLPPSIKVEKCIE
jgi:hypothetical protein